MVFGRIFYVKLKQKRISNRTESNETKVDINIISANIDVKSNNNIEDSEAGSIKNVIYEDDTDSYGTYTYNNHKFMPYFANVLIRNTLSLNF